MNTVDELVGRIIVHNHIEDEANPFFYYDVTTVTASTMGALLDAMVEKSYDAYDALVTHLTNHYGDGIEHDLVPHWGMLIDHPQLLEVTETIQSGSPLRSAIDVIREMNIQRNLVIWFARRDLMGSSYTTAFFGYNYFAEKDNIRHEGLIGADWDTDFAAAVNEGAFERFTNKRDSIRFASDRIAKFRAAQLKKDRK